jgi:hypothetical protein
MTLDEARERLKTFTFGEEDENAVPVLGVTPGSEPGLFNVLRGLIEPGADTGILTDSDLEAIRVYVGQWSEEEINALMAEAYAERARYVE